jgi:hypothetical protein
VLLGDKVIAYQTKARWSVSIEEEDTRDWSERKGGSSRGEAEMGTRRVGIISRFMYLDDVIPNHEQGGEPSRASHQLRTDEVL